jgi:putative transposase
MGIKRHKPEEIVTKLRQVEVLVGQDVARIDAIREVQITEQAFYRWLSSMVAWELLSSRN